MKTILHPRCSLLAATLAGITFILLLGDLPCPAQLIPVHSDIGYEGGNSTNRVVLTWEALPTKLYNVLSATSLTQQAWQTLTPATLYASNNLVRFRDTNNLPVRFYKVVKLDTEPPEVWRLDPSSNAIAVPLQSPLQVYLQDDTGIDPASVRLTVGTNLPVTLADSRLSLADNVLTYTPGTNEFLGTNGQTITNTLVVADPLGYWATNTWPFKLELAPILASNVVIVSPGSALTLVSTNGDTYVFSYSGASSGLTNGAILVSTDPSFPYKRMVLSLADDPANHTVSLVTTQASLADILVQGSVRFYGANFVPEPEAGRQSKDGGMTIPLGGYTLWSNDKAKVETTAGRLFFDPDFSVAADFAWGLSLPPVRMTSFDLDVSAAMAFDLTLHAIWEDTWSFAPTPRPIGRPLRKFRLLGAIPTPIPIPVWAEAVWEFSIGTEGEMSGLASASAGFQSTWQLGFSAKLRDGEWTHDSRNAPQATVFPVAWEGDGSARIRGFVEGKMTLYLESLVGPTANVRPYLEVVGNACVQPGQVGADVSLYDGLNGTLALALRGWDQDWASLPSWEMFNMRGLIWHGNVTKPVGSEHLNIPPNMVWIPCGTFTMGSPDSELGRYSDEGPQTRVTLSQGFWMGKYEVTQGEYLAVMGSNPSYFQGGNLPVETVSWNDAVAYCAALTARERSAGRLPAGYGYRLPTEAEWEYACRAGTTTPFHYGNGNELRSGMANFDGHCEYPPCGGSTYYCYNPSGIYLERTTSVGSYAPNAWGLYDMHGNVWEWCQDWWSASLPGGSVTDPQGSLTGSYRVVRGGSWGDYASYCRSAFRGHGDPADWSSGIGFRVVLAPGQP